MLFVCVCEHVGWVHAYVLVCQKEYLILANEVNVSSELHQKNDRLNLTKIIEYIHLCVCMYGCFGI